MAKRKITDTEVEVIKDAIIDEVATEEITPTVEVVLNVPAPEREDPGHNTRAFRQ